MYEREQLDGRLTEIIRQNLPDLPDSVSLSPNSDLPALGLDSYRMVTLLVQLENAFQVQFPDSALTIETFASPHTLWQVLTSVATQR